MRRADRNTLASVLELLVGITSLAWFRRQLNQPVILGHIILLQRRNREDSARGGAILTQDMLLPLRVLLAVNTPAILVLRPVEPVLLPFGQMAVVLGFIDAFPLRDVGIVGLIAGGFLPGHRAIRQALIDPRLLIVQPLIDLVDTRMIGNVLRHCRRRPKTRAAQNSNL
jgi:hypothetical protein